MQKIKMALFGIFCALTGCSSVTTEHYAKNKPVYDLRKYLNGKVEAWGVLEDYSNKVTRYFTATLVGTWNGNDGTLEEEFIFDDGEKQYRTWTVKYSDDNNFTATAADVSGTAIGTQHGNAVNMQYVLKVPVSGSTYEFSMDDWMYLVDERTVVNRTKMKKLGVTVAELSIFFRK